MAKKQMLFKTKGMNRDLSVSAFNPEFAFENMNLRLSTNEGNTMMSWVNEKGTASIDTPKFWEKDGDIVFSQPDPEEGWAYHEGKLEGIPVGTAVLNHKLVLFTTEGSEEKDHIYVIEYYDVDKTIMLIREKYGKNIGLDENHPLETLVSYESEKIQKVYWVDSKNQPRVINIAAEGIADKPNTFFDFIPTLQLKEEVTVKKILGGNGTFAPGVIQYAFTYYNKYGQESNIFYTTPLCYISHKDRGASPEDKVDNVFKISVRHPDTNYDYLRIYSIQRTSINGTPIVKRIQDISMKDYSDTNLPITREYASSELMPVIHANGSTIDPTIVNVSTINILGTSAECYEFTKYQFSDLKITIRDWNISFVDTATENSVIWLTKYKISYNGVYAYYIIGTTNSAATTQEDISMVLVEEPCLTYTDTGTSGDSVDPTELLYKGGESIIANTIEQKDGTLFLGNFKNERINLNLLREDIKRVTTINSEHIVDNSTVQYTRQIKAVAVSTGNYSYASQLTSTTVNGATSVPCGGFKRGDYYRCGVQFQHKSGKWSDPIYINDVEVKGTPSINTGTSTITLPVLKGHITNESEIQAESTTIGKLINGGYRRVRPVVVFPEMKDRVTLFQGVAAPTVYTNDRRIGLGTSAEPKGDLYAQSSWFFRTPYTRTPDDSQIESDATVAPYYGIGDNDHIPYAYAGIRDSQEYNPKTIRGVEIQGDFSDDNRFKVDNTFLTLHSPDIEFDTQLWNTSFENTTGYKIGKAQISNTWSDINIQTETPTVSEKGAGFTHKSFSKAHSYGIVSGLFYEDFAVDDGDHLEAWTDEQSAYKWMVYPWNKEGSLNNDINRPSNEGTPTAILKKKAISNLRITDTIWENSVGSFSFSGNPELFTSEEVSIVKVDGKVYEGNIDTMLTPDVSDGMYFAHSSTNPKANVGTLFTTPISWKTYSKNPNQADQQGLRRWNGNTWNWDNAAIGNDYVDLVMKKAGVRMKYKSTPHVVFKQDTGSDLFGNNYYILPIVEIRRTADSNFLSNIYGGTSTDALKENNWIPCGEPVAICDSNEAPLSNIEFEYSYGDTYFQRWDCLKTYAFTKEDTNQVVEIGSFMLESRINCDGRYDRNRGQVNNTNMSPQNFNLMNPVYSQIDNFFSYKILDDSYYENTNYLNQVTWSKTKESGADVDLWTNITLASVLELDGDKGELNKLIRFNNYLFAFQDRGISQILYNDNVQIQSTQGVPIEIANSGKVSGKDYKSSSIGCSNKWSMVTTPNGIYFMDSNDKSIYLFNGQLANISNAGGFNSWCKLNIPSAEDRWTPVPYEENQQGINIGGFESFVGYYDKLNQDVLYINNETALAWSEKMQAFTSFYDYGNTPFFCNLDDTGVWISSEWNLSTRKYDCHLWKHQGGQYCKFFNTNKPYWMTLVGNPDPQISKFFTNLEFRACVDGEGHDTEKYKPFTPFDKLETWNEYQHGVANIDNRSGNNLFKHHSMVEGNYDASLIRKFRIWRCDIPRDNTPKSSLQSSDQGYTLDSELGITRLDRHPLDRMNNPWLYLKLMKNAEQTPEFAQKRTEIHDVVMTYFE